MRVHLSAAGREVTLECADANVTARDVAAVVLGLWLATADGGRPPAAGVGFVGDRRQTRTVSPSHPGGYGRGHMREVDASIGGGES